MISAARSRTALGSTCWSVTSCPAETFLRLGLGAHTIYADEDFAAIELLGSVLMLHADHSYVDHEMAGVTAGIEVRGAVVEIRLYGADPDAIEARAREHGYVVLAGSIDKPHGLRECHIVAPDGYVFVASRAISRASGAETVF